MNKLLATFLASVVTTCCAVSTGCTGALSLENRPCPCEAGWTCCASKNVCVADATSCPNESRPVVTPQSNPTVTCSTDDECIVANNGRAAICPALGGQCRSLATGACEVAGNFKDRNALFFALLSDTASSDPSASKAYLEQVQFADEEAVAALPMGGVPGGVNGARRPIVLMTCKVDSSDANAVTSVANHVANVIRAPVVISDGTLGVRAYAAMATSTTPPVSFILGYPSTVRRALSGTADTSLIFQLPMPLDVSGLVASRLAELETRARADANFDGPALRVALVSADAEAWVSASPRVTETLSFNGVTAASQLGGNFQAFSYGPTGKPANEIAAAIDAFAPHVILLLGGPDLQQAVVGPIESGWSSPWKPYYLGGPDIVDPTTLALIAGNASVRDRISAVSLTIATDAKSADVQSRLAAVHPGDPSRPLSGYDAFYTALYAVVAAGNVPNGQPSGQDVALGLKKVATGTSTYVGSSELPLGMANLINDGTMRLRGLSSNLDFAASTGAPQTDAHVVCVDDQGVFGACP